MSSMPLVSVIVPCYNATAYLQRCVLSVLGQTMPDFELLLIDDCSTDNTYALMQKLAATDGRIRILQTEANGGPGATRNVGIEAARGKFVLFLDADDALVENCLSVLCHTAAENQADLVGYGLYKVDGVTGKREPFHWPPQNVPGGWAAVHLLESGRELGPWGATIFTSRELIERNKLRFTQGAYEDLWFKFRTLYHARRFVNIRDDLYLYYTQPQSVSSLVAHNRRFSYIHSYLTILDYVFEWLDSLKLRGDFVPPAEENAAYDYFLVFTAYFMHELEENIGSSEFEALFDEYAAREFGKKAVYIKTLTRHYQRLSARLMEADKKTSEQAALIEFYEAAAPELRVFRRRQELANNILALSAAEWEHIDAAPWYDEFWQLALASSNDNPALREKAAAFVAKLDPVMTENSVAVMRQKALLAEMLYRRTEEVIPYIEPEIWSENLRKDFIEKVMHM